MSCLAFRDSAWHPCRNWATLETLPDGSKVRSFTCRQHANFFDPTGANCRFRRAWFPSRGTFTRGARRNIWYLHNDPTRRRFVEAALSHGLIKVTEEDIESLDKGGLDSEAVGKLYACFFALCARHVPSFNHEWPPLGSWSHAVTYLWSLSEKLGPWDCSQETIFEMICTPGRPLAFILGIDTYPFEQANRMIQSLEEWFIVLERAATFDPLWFEEWIHRSERVLGFMKDPYVLKHSSHPLFHNIPEFQAWLVAKLEAWKETKKRRLEPVKEELIAATWHPDRMQQWCLDLEQRTEMRAMWSDFKG